MKSAVVLLASIAAVALVGREAFRSSSAGAAPGTSQKTVAVSPRPDAMPVVRQAYRNNCETASLSMLLAAAGVWVDQRELQRRIAKSGDPDPTVAADGTWTWGDPALGFVGRVRLTGWLAWME